MSNVFDQAFSLSQSISEKIIDSGIIKISSPQRPGINIFQTSGLALMNSYASLFPDTAALIVFDCPRASKRVPVELFDFMDDGQVETKSIKYNDPNYRYLLTANILAAARFAIRCVADDGVICVVTTPDVYLVARGAFEHYLGSDKFLGELVYQSRAGGGADSLHLSVDHETLLIFAKNPSSISRFSLDKNDTELGKYKHEDDVSKYYWDTYIRKQARNYYAIEAPDGTILEIDDDGNRISWLWRRKTFLEKCTSDDIKFEKVGGKWKLYYKDRLKETKILRSISLNATVLKDISKSLPKEMTGGDLLNKKGSAEIKSFTGVKPDYLKPSAYYEFISKVFNPRAGPLLIPYPDYGSAIPVSSGIGNPVYLNSKPEHVDLLKWRADAIGASIKLSSNETYDLESFFGNNEGLDMNLVSQLVSIKYNLLGEWLDFIVGNTSSLYSPHNNNLAIIFNEIDWGDRANIEIAISKLLKDAGTTRLAVFSRYENSLIEPIFSNKKELESINYFRVPQVFL